MDTSANLLQRFTEYFTRDIAEQAAKTIADGAEVQLNVQTSGAELLEEFYFTRVAGKNEIRTGSAPSPQLIFLLTPKAAEQVLNDPAQDVGTIGINLLKLIASPDANLRISFKIKTGFFDLFNKGYFGVLATGGHQFAGYLASIGLSGIGTIKNVLKNHKD